VVVSQTWLGDGHVPQLMVLHALLTDPQFWPVGQVSALQWHVLSVPQV
jgi:hypothetical protein